MTTLQRLGIDRMTNEERLQLLGEIWDSLDQVKADDLSPEARAELDRRLDAADADPDGGEPLEEVMARLRAGK